MAINSGQQTSSSTSRRRPDPNNERNKEQAEQHKNAVFEMFKRQMEAKNSNG